MHRNHRRESASSPRTARDTGSPELELRPLLGVDEVARLLGVPKATLYRWHSLSTADAPQGPRAFRVGKHLRYTLDDVRSYIEHLRLNSA